MSERKGIEESLERMLKTTKTHDNLNKMLKVTRSFDEEVAQRNKAGQEALVNAVRKMLHHTHTLERQNERAIRTGIRIQKLQSKTANSAYNKSLSGKLIERLPAKYRNLPLAFRRNPRLVLKYFLGMLIGRLLAITIYVLAAFIPTIPVPESVQGLVGRPVKALGSVVIGARGLLTDPSLLMGTLTNIPTDINKLLQKVGEFFQFYGRRVWAFLLRSIRHPRLAYEDVTKWSRENARFFRRMCRTAVAVTFSFIMLKLAMVFLLPLFGGIAITIAGMKVTILLMVVVRMIVDKVGEIIGTKIFGKLSGLFKHRH